MYAITPAKRMKPSILEMEPSSIIAHAITVIASIIGASLRTTVFWTAIGTSNAAIGSMRHMFAMFEPSTFPTPSSPFPSRLAFTDANISGALVPNATTVTPMTNGLSPSLLAILAAPRMSSSAPTNVKAMPTMRKRTAMGGESRSGMSGMCVGMGGGIGG